MLPLECLIETSHGFAANDTLQVGLIGVGGRCKHLLKSFPALPNVKITAVCDVLDDNLEAAKKLADPKAFATKKHEELLARKDVDAVLNRNAGPLARSAHHRRVQSGQGRVRREAADARSARRQGGGCGAKQKQARGASRHAAASMTHILKAYELLKAGAIGRRFTRFTAPGTATRTAFKRAKTRSTRSKVDWKRFLGTAKPARLRCLPVPAVAVVLGLRRRHLHST